MYRNQVLSIIELKLLGSSINVWFYRYLQPKYLEIATVPGNNLLPLFV